MRSTSRVRTDHGRQRAEDVRTSSEGVSYIFRRCTTHLLISLSSLMSEGRPLDTAGDRWEGPSTARPLEACERLMSGFLQRHGPLPRHARTLKTTWCAWQWRPPLPSAHPRGRPVASERAAWWCCWWQILRPDRRLRPPALSSLPYRPRVIRHVRPLTEGVGEWRLATLQHTLSREPETLLSVSVLDAIEKCVSARDVPFEGDLDAGPERPLGVVRTRFSPKLSSSASAKPPS